VSRVAHVIIDGVRYVPETDLSGCQPWSSKLLTLRTEAGLTLDQLAQVTRISRTKLHELENGVMINPRLDCIRDLLKFYSVSFDDLFGIR
jgi:DNA-binding XRE family transcriptional regulator